MTEKPNLDYIKEIAGGSEAFEQQLIDIVKREFPAEKSEFLNNYHAKAYRKTAENVHKLKHKIGMMGLENGYTLAVDFEEELKLNKTTLFPKFMLTLSSIEDFLINL
ncbi:Hpt domain-containing protein [Aquimarina hainanensis]|uniref:Hpt domain-containing protein n=1 Tax=Aquimarina hainanensis TaxID=1578017 RepID=A0ABW5N6K1_9FLAO